MPTSKHTRSIYNALRFTAIPVLLLLVMGFQCGYRNITRLSVYMDVVIEPNPIEIIDQKGQFDFSFAYPPNQKVHKKYDSITFTFTTSGPQAFQETEVVPSAVFDNGNRTTQLQRSFEFTYEMPADTVPLLLQMTLHKNGKWKSTPKLQVAYLINSD